MSLSQNEARNLIRAMIEEFARRNPKHWISDDSYEASSMAEWPGSMEPDTFSSAIDELTTLIGGGAGGTGDSFLEWAM